MANKVALTREQIAEYKTLIGLPPVLSSENQTKFEKIFDLVIATVAPLNIIEFMYIRRHVCAQWLASHYTRAGIAAIGRHVLQNREFAATRQKLREARKEKQAAALAEEINQTPADIAHLVGLEDKIHDTVERVDDMLDRPASEREHNRALEQSMIFQEQISKLTITQLTIADDALRELELCRTGLDVIVHQVTAQTIEGECKEVGAVAQADAPSIAPSGE
jgi:hypothetical protein